MPDTPPTATFGPAVGQNDDVTTARPRSFRIPDPLYDEFTAACEVQGEDKAAVVRRAMRAYVIDPNATEAALAAIRGGTR